MGELYEYIDSWDGHKIFTYIAISIILFWFISRRQLTVSEYIGLVVVAFVISYLNNRSMNTIDTKDEIQTIKKDAIIPKLNDEAITHNNVVDMLFSIQDMYHYNPRQYETMIHSINSFYSLYKLAYVDESTVFTSYDMMDQYKRDALNALASMIFSIPTDKIITNKLNTSVVVLDEIMTKDLDQISYLIDNYIYKKGYDINTKIVYYGPKAYNEYDDMFKSYSYEIY